MKGSFRMDNNNKLINWSTVYNYSLDGIEEKIVKRLFQEFANGNSAIGEYASGPEMENYYFIFRHGWVVGKLFGWQKMQP
jgi:hypothetical protein